MHWATSHAADSLGAYPQVPPRPSRTRVNVVRKMPATPRKAPDPAPVPVPKPVPLDPVLAPIIPPTPLTPPPTTQAKPADKPKPARPTPVVAAAQPTPNGTPSTVATPAIPIQGLSFESTSTTGLGPAAPVGNTLDRTAGAPADTVAKPLPGTPGAPAAPAHTVTTMPAMLGNCRGTYTEAARRSGIEGTVLLDLVVDDQGHAREIKVVKGLGQGLDEAAILAAERCRFRPATRGSDRVAVQLHAFKVRFVLDDNP